MKLDFTFALISNARIKFEIKIEIYLIAVILSLAGFWQMGHSKGLDLGTMSSNFLKSYKLTHLKKSLLLQNTERRKRLTHTTMVIISLVWFLPVIMTENVIFVVASIFAYLRADKTWWTICIVMLIYRCSFCLLPWKSLIRFFLFNFFRRL